MKPSIPLTMLLAAVLSGCAAGAPPPPATPAEEAAPPARPRTDFRVFTAREAGFSVALPGEAREVRASEQDGGATIAISGLVAEGPGGVVYRAVRERLPTGYLPKEEVVFRNAAQPLRKSASGHSISLGGFRGREVEGLTASGTAGVIRVFCVGGGTYRLSVEGPPDLLDRDDARRFLTSFRLVTPFRMVASPEGRYTVAVPGTAAEAKSSERTNAGTLETHTFQLGGEQQLVYGVFFLDLPAERLQRPVEELLAAMARSAASSQGADGAELVRVGTAGLPGVELSVKTRQGAHVRMRILLSGGRVYELFVGAKDPLLLHDHDADAFLGSFRATS